MFIINDISDFRKADELITQYLEKNSINDAHFNYLNYFNNTRTNYICVKSIFAENVIKEIKKKKNEKNFRKLLDLLWFSNDFQKMIIAAKLYPYVETNFDDYIKIVKKIDNWAHCDVFCSKVSGPYFYKNPDKLEKIVSFAKSNNPWERRFATVSLITTLRNVDGDHKKALEILDMLMTDTAQKEVMAATDWMIREYLRKNYDKGFEYMLKWADYAKKNNDKNVRWVLVRARHKLQPKDKKEIEKIIGMKK